MRPSRKANDRRRLQQQVALHSSGCWQRLDLARFADLLEAGEPEIRCEHCGGVLYRARREEGE